MTASTPHGRTLLVSATDARFFPQLQAMLATLRPRETYPAMDLACFDIGLSDAERDWLAAYPVRIARPRPHLGIDAAAHPPALLSFLARPFLPEEFPGYDTYVWVDSDIWFQQPRVLDRYLDGAASHGFAITHESARGYRLQPWLIAWTAKHLLAGYGAVTAAWLLGRRHFNAGLFAGRVDAPHWAAWARRYAAAIARTGALVPHDQFALVRALHGDPWHRSARLPCAMLDPTCNWIVDRGIPVWSDAADAFCEPTPPHAPIAVLHLAGPGKRTTYDVRRIEGGNFRTRIVAGASPTRPIADAACRVAA